MIETKYFIYTILVLQTLLSAVNVQPIRPNNYLGYIDSDSVYQYIDSSNITIVVSGSNLDDIVRNSCCLILLLKSGTYNISYIINSSNIVLKPFGNGPVYIYMVNTYVNMSTNISFIGGLNIFIKDLTVNNSINISLINNTIHGSRNATIELFNSEFTLINNTLNNIQVQTDNSTLQVSNCFLRDIRLVEGSRSIVLLLNNVLINDFIDLVEDPFKLAMINNQVVNYTNIPEYLIRAENLSHIDELVIENNTICTLIRSLFLYVSNNTKASMERIIIYRNIVNRFYYFTVFNTTYNSVLNISLIKIIGNIYKIEEYMKPYHIIFHAHNNSRINMGRFIFAGNTITRGIVYKDLYLFRFASDNSSYITVGVLNIYGNIIYEPKLCPTIAVQGNISVSPIYYSLKPIDYFYNGSLLHSRIGNYFACIVDKGIDIGGENHDGIGDRPVLYGGYYDPYPIAYHRPYFFFYMKNPNTILININGYTGEVKAKNRSLVLPAVFMTVYIDNYPINIGLEPINIVIVIYRVDSIYIVSNGYAVENIYYSSGFLQIKLRYKTGLSIYSSDKYVFLSSNPTPSIVFDPYRVYYSSVAVIEVKLGGISPLLEPSFLPILILILLLHILRIHVKRR